MAPITFNLDNDPPRPSSSKMVNVALWPSECFCVQVGGHIAVICCSHFLEGGNGTGESPQVGVRVTDILRVFYINCFPLALILMLLFQQVGITVVGLWENCFLMI